MYLLSTFDQTEYLELAITALQQDGIPKAHILAVPLDMNRKKQGLGDTMHYSDVKSFFDTGALIATFFGSLGSIIGFQLHWGPIVWGLAGFFIGGLLGFLGDYFLTRIRNSGTSCPKKKSSEVILTVYCSNQDANRVEKTLWDHFANGVAKLNLTSDQVTK